jgi:hypothetical protein
MEGSTIDHLREDFAHIDRFQRKITSLPLWPSCCQQVAVTRFQLNRFHHSIYCQPA